MLEINVWNVHIICESRQYGRVSLKVGMRKCSRQHTCKNPLKRHHISVLTVTIDRSYFLFSWIKIRESLIQSSDTKYVNWIATTNMSNRLSTNYSLQGLLMLDFMNNRSNVQKKKIEWFYSFVYFQSCMLARDIWELEMSREILLTVYPI